MSHVSTAPSQLCSSSAGTSPSSTIPCTGIATPSTTRKTRLSSAPPWGEASTVRPAPGDPVGSQPGALDLPEVQKLPRPETGALSLRQCVQHRCWSLLSWCLSLFDISSLGHGWGFFSGNPLWFKLGAGVSNAKQALPDGLNPDRLHRRLGRQTLTLILAKETDSGAKT